jgi:hypothetical protein
VQFENQSRLEAALLRGGLPDERRMLAVVVAKACAKFDPKGHGEIDLTTKTPICHEPHPHSFGTIPADTAPRKQGLDVLALGKVYHPRLEGGTDTVVTVSVNRESRDLKVFGERSWYRTATGEWAAQSPLPFSLLDMSWQNSFGGLSFDEWGNDLPHSLNAEGKGFIASEHAIEGTPLPNVEDASAPIRHWQDQPNPCNLAPAPKALAFDPSPHVEALKAAPVSTFRVPDEFWNDAVKKFRFPTASPGQVISLSGMSEQPLLLTLPAQRIEAQAFVGSRNMTLPLTLDTVLFLPEARSCLLTWRASFVYEIIPREKRQVTLQAVI